MRNEYDLERGGAFRSQIQMDDLPEPVTTLITHASEIPRDLRRYVDLDWYFATHVAPTSICPPSTLKKLLLSDQSPPSTIAVCIKSSTVQQASSISESARHPNIVLRVKNYMVHNGEFLWRIEDQASPEMLLISFQASLASAKSLNDLPSLIDVDTLYSRPLLPESEINLEKAAVLKSLSDMKNVAFWKAAIDKDSLQLFMDTGKVLKFTSKGITVEHDSLMHKWETDRQPTTTPGLVLAGTVANGKFDAITLDK